MKDLQRNVKLNSNALGFPCINLFWSSLLKKKIAERLPCFGFVFLVQKMKKIKDDFHELREKFSFSKAFTFPPVGKYGRKSFNFSYALP